jgi:hypothetical protein
LYTRSNSRFYDAAVSFHVQLQQSHHSARLFNLSEDDLRRQLFEPWSRGVQAQVAERDWDPAEARLTVLEGPALDPSELAFGRGWGKATKIGRDVTRELLARELPPRRDTVAVVWATPQARALALALLDELGLRVSNAPEPEPSAMTIVVEDRTMVLQLRPSERG